MNLAVSMIHGYRRWISPYKGFRCAHHVVYGCGSCSDYGLEVFQSDPFLEAWSKLKERLKACRTAKQIYQSQSQETEEERRRRLNQNQPQRSGWADGCDCEPLTTILACDLLANTCDMSAISCPDGCAVDSCF